MVYRILMHAGITQKKDIKIFFNFFSHRKQKNSIWRYLDIEFMRHRLLTNQIPALPPHPTLFPD